VRRSRVRASTGSCNYLSCYPYLLSIKDPQRRQISGVSFLAAAWSTTTARCSHPRFGLFRGESVLGRRFQLCQPGVIKHTPKQNPRICRPGVCCQGWGLLVHPRGVCFFLVRALLFQLIVGPLSIIRPHFTTGTLVSPEGNRVKHTRNLHQSINGHGSRLTLLT
jgi:hypothetical protein